MINYIEKVIGCEPEVFCDAFYAEQPKWVFGSSISQFDTYFLFKTALTSGANTAVEIGTASGFSTAVLCHALNFASQAGLISSDFQVVSFDLFPHFYADESKRVGDAAREQLSPELLKHITFRNPATAADVRKHYGNDEIKLMFIDASHRHPWPTLDLLATLDCLSPGAVVLLHDINLPVIHPEFPDWGAKHLFDDLKIEKDMPQDEEIPNIGSIRIPEDKEQLRGQLLQILFTHEWQANVNKDYLVKLGINKTN